MKLLMISTDKNIFNKKSTTALRQIEYSKKYEEVHIIVFTKKGCSESTLGQNIWIYPTRSGSRWAYIFDALRIGRFITEKRAITHITCQDPFETGVVGVLIKNRYKNAIPTLELQVHTDIGSPYFQNFSFLNRVRIFISKYTLPKADSVRVVSDRIKKYISKHISESKIYVKPIFVDAQKIQSAPIHTDLQKKYPQFNKIVLMVSRLEKEKNIAMAIRAWKIVLEKYKYSAYMVQTRSPGLVIVGSGSEEWGLRRLVEGLKMEGQVIFEGWQEDIASYYKTCDCFLVTSWYEGYGMTLAEAQAFGCKIVSTDVGIAEEVKARIVEHNEDKIAVAITEMIL